MRPHKLYWQEECIKSFMTDRGVSLLLTYYIFNKPLGVIYNWHQIIECYTMVMIQITFFAIHIYHD